MASLEKAIHDLLTGNQTIAAIVGRKVRPLMASMTDEPPYVTTSIEREAGFQTIADGPADYRRARVELGAYAQTYLDCAELSEAVRNLDGFGETTADGVEFDLDLDEESEIEEGLIPGTEYIAHVRVLTFSCLYRVTTT